MAEINKEGEGSFWNPKIDYQTGEKEFYSLENSPVAKLGLTELALGTQGGKISISGGLSPMEIQEFLAKNKPLAE